MANIEKISVIELLNQSKNNNISKIPDEVTLFFNKNFDFKNWKWSSKHDFWKFLDTIFNCSCDRQNEIIYFKKSKDKLLLIELVNYIIYTLQDEDTSEYNKKIAFELSCMVPNFWQNCIKKNILFSQSSKNLAIDYMNRISFEFFASSDALTYEKESIDYIRRILQEKEWGEIAEYNYLIQYILEYLSLASNQFISFLFWHDQKNIIEAINRESNPDKLLYFIAHIPNDLKFQFLLELNDNYIAIFLLLLNLCSSKREFNYKSEIRKIFIKLDKSLLKHWLFVLNTYPCRYPLIQLGLGVFLAESSDLEIVEIYINSINLEGYSDDIRECVDYFLNNSNGEVRKLFCELAYKKWEEWDYERSCSIKRSAFDRVIVYFFQNYVTDLERNEFIQSHIVKIERFQEQWFDNKIDLDKFVYFHLSKIQPACMANMLKEDAKTDCYSMNKKIFYPGIFYEDLRWVNWIDLERFSI